MKPEYSITDQNACTNDQTHFSLLDENGQTAGATEFALSDMNGVTTQDDSVYSYQNMNLATRKNP